MNPDRELAPASESLTSSWTDSCDAYNREPVSDRTVPPRSRCSPLPSDAACLTMPQRRINDRLESAASKGFHLSRQGSGREQGLRRVG